MKKYSLTEDHRSQLKPWADKWIANTMSTKTMSADDKLDCREFVKQLYDAANLPAPKHILFVKSPIALTMATGFSLAIIEMGKSAKVTIPEMVNQLNEDPTCLSPLSFSKWYVSPYNIKKLANRFGVGELGMKRIKDSHLMWNGGNQWNDYGPEATAFPGGISGYVIEFGTWTNPDDQTFTEFYNNSALHSNGPSTALKSIFTLNFGNGIDKTKFSSAIYKRNDTTLPWTTNSLKLSDIAGISAGSCSFVTPSTSPTFN